MPLTDNLRLSIELEAESASAARCRRSSLRPQWWIAPTPAGASAGSARTVYARI
jgi:hypothetical protein